MLPPEQEQELQAHTLRLLMVQNRTCIETADQALHAAAEQQQSMR
jgi:hypothetical protein